MQFTSCFCLIGKVDEEEIEDFKIEINFMKTLGRHENVVTMLGCCTLYPPLCLIVEYVPYGDLLKYLRNLRNTVRSQNIFYQENSQSISQPINQAINQSINQSITQPINQSISQSVNQSINQSVSQSINQSVSQSVSQSIIPRGFFTAEGDRRPEGNPGIA